jgi:hypothetical protein
MLASVSSLPFSSGAAPAALGSSHAPPSKAPTRRYSPRHRPVSTYNNSTFASMAQVLVFPSSLTLGPPRPAPTRLIAPEATALMSRHLLSASRMGGAHLNCVWPSGTSSAEKVR